MHGAGEWDGGAVRDGEGADGCAMGGGWAWKGGEVGLGILWV